jgi:hypothetical protein
MTVHVIETAGGGDPRAALDRRAALGRAIAALAARRGETVWFHDFADPVGGAPVILLECADDFLAAAARLPGFGRAHPLAGWPGIKSVRSPEIQKYYQPPGPAPRP